MKSPDDALEKLRADTAKQMLAFSAKLAAGADTLAKVPRSAPGATPKDEVYAVDNARLYRFRSAAALAKAPPVLIVYALVNRHYMLDLEPDRSFVRGVLDEGRDVYLLDWGYPRPQDTTLGLDDYVNRYLHACVEHLCARSAQPRIDLLGVCQGGTLSLCYAALEPSRVRRLVLMVAPVDFHVPGFLLARWLRHVDVDALVNALGNVPGELLNWAFLALKPMSLSGLKALDLIELMDRPDDLATFARMEQWLQDSPDQAGEAFRQFTTCFFKDNALVRDRLRLGERRVRLSAIEAPVLNVYAERDHIVPPASSRRLDALLEHEDYTEYAFAGGHVGMFASRRARHKVPHVVCEWLARATEPAPTKLESTCRTNL